MSNPLIIPGDDGDELYDATAAANYLGMAVSTLRSHQYQDGKRTDPDAGPEVPKPEHPDDVAIQLPEGAGVEWARIIEELMLRAGGSGRPVRLWSLRKLDAYLAVTRDPEVRLARAMFGKDSSITKGITEVVADAVADEVVHGHSTWEQFKARRAAGLEAASADMDRREAAIRADLAEAAAADGAALDIEARRAMEEKVINRALIDAVGVTVTAGSGAAAVAEAQVFLADLIEAAADELEQMTVPLTMGGVGGPVIGTAKVFEDERGVYGEMTITDPEAAELLKPDIRPGSIEFRPKLTAREVLEQARLRREAR